MTSTERNDILHNLAFNPKTRVIEFLKLDANLQVELLFLLSKRVKSNLLNELANEQVIDLVDRLDPDDATDVIQLLQTKRQKLVVKKLGENLKTSVTTLLKFDPETAAGLMNIDYIQEPSDTAIKLIANDVKKHESRTGKLPTILIIDNGKLLGYLPVHELALAKPSDKASKYIKKINTIKYDAKAKEVINHFRSHPHSKVAVLGKNKQVLGLIYTDDILKLIQTKGATSLYNFAGISDEESIYDNTSRKVNFRYKWLMINLATAFLAAFTVGLFDEIITKYVLLAVYMPIVAGMGGNSATQTLAVMVRGLSQGEIGFSTLMSTLKSEISSGIINGVLNGLIVTVIVYFFNNDLLIGIVLGLAMIVNLFIAATFGTIIPVIMKKLGKDPASSATIFITTATDVFGFLAFLGLATALLP